MSDFNQVQFIEVTDNNKDQRLDNFLIKLAKGVPKSRIYRAVRKGEVRVNKKRAKADYKLQVGDSVRLPPLYVRSGEQTILSNAMSEVILDSILYQDDNLLVLNKPANMAVHGGTNTDFSLINVLRQFQSEWRQMELVHRLDKATSGCLILAKNMQSLRNLQQQLIGQKMTKTYYCLAKGSWNEDCSQVKLPLRKNIVKSGERMVCVDPEGKPAHTEFKLVNQYDNCMLLKAVLHTGRTHQIRVHLQYLCHFLAGDNKYGDREFNKWVKSFGLKRMFLHAHSVKFYLPDSKKAITVTAPLDDELTLCLQNLAKISN